MREQGRDQIEQRGQTEDDGKQRVDRERPWGLAERCHRSFPSIVVKNREVATHPLDAHMQRKHSLERRCQEEQWSECRNRRRGESEAGDHDCSPCSDTGHKHTDAHGPALTDRRAQFRVFLLFTRCHLHVLWP